jgi:DNA-binding NarL/FixJ family response regulator
MEIRVVIADDSAAVRRGLRNLLSRDNEIEIVGEAGDYAHMAKIVVETNPHVVVMDLNMPNYPDGNVPGLRSFFQPGSEPPIIVISFAIDSEAKQRAVQLGAKRMLDKTNLASELIPTIRELIAP